MVLQDEERVIGHRVVWQSKKEEDGSYLVGMSDGKEYYIVPKVVKKSLKDTGLWRGVL